MSWWGWLLVLVGGALVALVAYDLLQRRHTILRNFPVIGHLRFILEAFGPELRQYIVTGNDEERPFSRNQRRWIYASSKGENNRFGFGTDASFEREPGWFILKPAAFPLSPPPGGDAPDGPLPCAKVLGGPRGRRHAFRPASAVNVSGMSFGALSARAVQAINEGARLAGCLHNTGEGGVSPHHLQGGDLVLQLGTAYFGVRDAAGRLDMARLVAVCDEHPVRAIEVKLSQGAKPGIGGLLPGAKVTPEIARIRGVRAGQDVVSPPSHPEFRDADEMLDLVERIADATGLPVGIKSAVGEAAFWERLADLMAAGDRGVDFITIDGGEGGTGAGPLAFVDHVALPFRLAHTRVLAAFGERGVQDRVVWIGSGKLGLPDQAVLAMALGCDMVNVAREAMMSIGCIQAQRCHTGRCPAGVATQSRWLQRGLGPEMKAVRLASYVATMRRDMLRLARACGVPHPALVGCGDVEILDGEHACTGCALYGLRREWTVPAHVDLAALAGPLTGVQTAR